MTAIEAKADSISLLRNLLITFRLAYATAPLVRVGKKVCKQAPLGERH
jgi:hypothetical protein